MMTESRGLGSNLILGGAVRDVDPESATRSPPRPLRSKEETSESDSGSARGTKRKRATEPRDRDSAGSGSDDSSGSPLRRPKAPLMPICTEEDGTVLYGFTDDQDVMDRYHDDMQKYIKKRGMISLSLHSFFLPPSPVST
jgi:hypothetical protein